MTALTTITGLLPLAIGASTVGGLFYFPLARTVMGGLLSSTFLTLIVLPSMDIWVENAAGWFSRIWRASKPEAAPTASEPVPAA